MQGLKSLASKLHPQLPLSPKESHRLLTALTSSFRKQLDEAHPWQARDDDSRPATASEPAATPGHHALHTSSVAFADRHLASVLTNPLLAKANGGNQATLNYDSARQELEQHPDKDPISLLEKYQQKGAATVPIADLCLRTFLASLEELPEDIRRKRVVEYRAGVRTLRWLWHSDVHKTNAFVDDRKFIGALVTMLIEEDEEQFLWSWLRLDARLGTPTQKPAAPPMWNANHVWRWKDFMLRLIILRRHQNDDGASMNAVLKTYFKAVDLHLAISKDRTRNFLPLGASVNAINNRIFNNRSLNQAWDVKLYDRYIETMDLSEDHNHPHVSEYKKAILKLVHPRHPSPLPMYTCVREGFSAEPTSPKRWIWRYFTKDRREKTNAPGIKTFHYYQLLETARQLELLGRTEETGWMVSQIRSIFPERSRYLKENMKKAHVPPPNPSKPVHPLTPHRVMPITSFMGAEAT